MGYYLDDGISGTGIARRDEFKRMIEAADNGEIDIILTKSIQRFARNTVDLLETMRHLKDIGVEMRFEKGIPNGHFRVYGYRWEGDELVIVPEEAEIVRRIFQNFLDGKSRLAQEENRSISENVTWGQRKHMADGMVEFVTVGRDKEIAVTFRDGTEIQA